MALLSKQLILLLLIAATHYRAFAAEPEEKQAPDTVHVGIYITSIHDIDFKTKEYAVNFWLWLTYTNPELNFMQNLEIPQAKSLSKSYAGTDTLEDGRIYTLMKVSAVMKDSWKILHFPFDRQRMWLSIENAEFDSRYLVFTADTFGRKYDPKFAISGWTIDSFKVSVGVKAYETSFGDQSLNQEHAEYSTYKVRITIKRDAWGLFLKIFLGMYVAFLIAFICFFIHADNIDSRLGLSVGSLFAAIGNKYVIDSSLPESSSFTLVDTLHGITLLFIFSVVSVSAYSLWLQKQGLLEKANKTDMRWAWVLATIYLGLNIFFISVAVMS